MNEFGSIKDVVFVISALIGSFVALNGLSTWKKQLKGKVEYDLARRLLISLFRYRDAINTVRHPAIFKYEMPSPPDDEAKNMNREQISFYGTSKAYQSRWDKVQTERTNLYADLLESEALWGLDIKNLFTPLFQLEGELFSQIRLYLQTIDPEKSDKEKETYAKILHKKRDIMYDSLTDEDDDYKIEFRAGVESLEKALKDRLVR